MLHALCFRALLMDAALEAVEGSAQRLQLCDLQGSRCTSPPHQAPLAEAPGAELENLEMCHIEMGE